MFRRFSTDFAILCMLIDATLVILGLELARVYRPLLNNLFSFIRDVDQIPQVDVVLYGIFPIVWVLIMMSFTLYDGRRNFRFLEELRNLTAGSILSIISLAGLMYLSYREYSRVFFLTTVLISYIFLVVIRIFYRMLFRLQSQKLKKSQRSVLILGAGPVGRKIAEKISEYEGNGLKLAGFLDDDPLKLSKPNVLDKIDHAVTVIQQENINDVIIALPSRVSSRINALVSQLHELPVRVWVAPDYYTLALHRARVEELAGIPLIDLRAPALDEYQRLVKRMFDLVLTLLAMPFVLPLMGIIAIAIKLDSPGPVIFRQTRVGENGRLFEMLKFRTMIKDAESMRHLVEKVDENGKIILDKRKKDPRITRIGNILRRTSLDELPQLFNVLRGDMSLVGPRPELVHLANQYELWQRRRFVVPQGITGWWQVNGRSDKDIYQKTQDDIYYIHNYSLWLDIVILFKTLLAVLRRKGAY